MEPILQSEEFQKGLKNNDLPLLKQVPKTDLHCHANLSVRRSDLEVFAGQKIPAPPTRFPEFIDFINYINHQIKPHNHFSEGIKYCTKQAIQTAIEDGIVHLEMSVDTQFIAMFPSVQDFIEFVSLCVEANKKKIHFLPEIGIKRTLPIKEMERLVIPLIESGVFKCIDLYDDETKGHLPDIRPIFQYAKKAGLKLKAHAGEFKEAKYVAHIIEILELDAVQHGISAIEDHGVVQFLAQIQIPLNITPTSNVVLGRAESLSTHPIKTLFDNGVIVTINSDDLLIFDKSVNQEYLQLYQQGVFSADELDLIRLNGLKSLAEITPS